MTYYRQLTEAQRYQIAALLKAGQTNKKLETLIAPLRRQDVQTAKGTTKRGGKNAPGFDVQEALREWAGVDSTQIGGIDVCTVLKVLVELGTDRPIPV